MRKINKTVNIALIFILIGVFLWQDFACPLSDSMLRPPLQFNGIKEPSIEELEEMLVKLREAAGKVEKVINESGILGAIEELKTVIAKEDIQRDEIVRAVQKCYDISREKVFNAINELNVEYSKYKIVYIINKDKLDTDYLFHDLHEKLGTIFGILDGFLKLFQKRELTLEQFKNVASKQLSNLTSYLALLEDIKFANMRGEDGTTYKFLAYYYLRIQASANRVLQGVGNHRDDL